MVKLVEGEEAKAEGTQVDTYYMGLTKDSFTWTDNETYPNVSFEVEDGWLKITPVDDAIVVKIKGATDTKEYTGKPQFVTGYEVTSITGDTSGTFTKEMVKLVEGEEAKAEGTQVDTYYMGLTKDSFTWTDNETYPNVSFEVEDGWLKIDPVDDAIVVKIKGATDTQKYTGEPQFVTGYEVTSITGDTSGTFTKEMVKLVEGEEAKAEGTQVDTYYMGLTKDSFTWTDNETYPNVSFEVEDGWLKITPVDDAIVVKIKGATDTKEYTGKPQSVTGYEVEITGDTSGTFTKEMVKLVEGEEAKAEGTQVDTYYMGLTKDSFTWTDNETYPNVSFEVEDGWLKITPVDDAIVVKIKGATDTKEYTGEPQFVTGYEVTSITGDTSGTFTKEMVKLVEGEEAKAEGTQVDTYYMGLTKDSFTWTDNETYPNVSFEVEDGWLKITPVDDAIVVKIKGATDTKEYTGKPQSVTGYEVEITGDTSGTFTKEMVKLVEGEEAKAEGTQVDTYYMGLTKDSFTWTDNETYPNVSFEVEDGWLKITPVDDAIVVKIKGATDTKEYTGKPQFVTGYEVTSITGDTSGTFTKEMVKLVEGEEAKAEGTQVDTYYMGLTKDSFTWTDNETYPNVSFEVEDGWLKITPVDDAIVVKIKGATDTKEYTGEPQFVTGYEVTSITGDTSGTFTKEMVKLVEGEEAKAEGTQVDTYYMGLTKDSFTWTDNETYPNVSFEVEDGWLKITPVDDAIVVKIKGATDTKEYTGKPQSVTGYEVEITGDTSGTFTKEMVELVEGVEAKAEGTQVDTYYMGLTKDSFTWTDKTTYPNVSFEVEDGWLKITPVDDAIVVKIKGATDTKEYTGKPQSVTGYEVEITGDTSGTFTKEMVELVEGVEAKAEGTQVDTYYMGLTKDSFTWTDKTTYPNVSFEVEDGWLKITPVDDAIVVKIKGATDTKEYTGKPQSVTGYEVEITGDTSGTFTKEMVELVEGVEAKAEGTQVDTYYMGLTKDSFTWTDKTTYPNVSFEVEDGWLKITPVDDAIVVKITGATDTREYNGEQQLVTGYEVAEITGDTSGTFTKEMVKLVEGEEAKAEGTQVATYYMGLTKDSFTWTDKTTYPNVSFEVDDGWLKIEPVDDAIVVKITGATDTREYNGEQQLVTGYEVAEITGDTSGTFTKEMVKLVEGEEAKAEGTQVATYYMGLTKDSFTWTDKTTYPNVSFKVDDGWLKIEPRSVTVTINTATYTYDGTGKTVAGDDGPEYTVEREAANRGLLTDDTIDLNVVYGTDNAESKILVGQYVAKGQKETVKIRNGNDDVTANYAVTIIPGRLTITDGTQDDPVNPDGVVTKTHDGETYKLDETVTFDIEVKNIYNEAKTITITEQDGVTLEDADEAGKLVIENVAPGETVTAKATYTITEADILAGTFVNTVKVEFSEGKPFENGDDVDVEEPKAELKLEKTIVDRQVEYKLGEAIKYQIVVSNTGNVTRSDVVVTDDMFTRTGVAATILVNGVQVQPEGNQLKLGDVLPNTQITITYSYQVTSADIQVGKVTNTATVTGDVPEGVTKPEDPTVTEEAETEDIRATLTVTKTSDVAEGETVGLNGKIHYTITVTNKGNVPYENVVVKDELAGAVILAGEGYTVNADNTATIANLPVDGSVTVEAEYTVTSEDILNGHVKNIATATADPIEDPKTGEEKTPEGKGEEDDKTDPIDRELTVVKTSGSTDKVQQGETIHYTITVTNDGNVPYENVVVKDELAGAVILAGEGYTVNADNTATIANLPVNGSVTVEAEYTVTEADLANGAVVNVASATADPIPNPEGQTDPETPEGTSDPDERKVAKPDLSLEKKADMTVARPGDILTYTLTLANVGDGRAKDVVVTDALPEQVVFVGFVTTDANASVDADGLLTWTVDAIEGTADPAQPTTLALQFQVQIVAEEKENLTDGDLAIVNTAKIKDQPIDDPTDEDTEETKLARMDVAKTAEILNADGTVKADQSKASLGDIIHYEITVSNLGGSELPDVELTDAMILKAIDGSLKLDGQPVAADQLTAEVVNIGALAIGASKVLSYDYQVVEADILAGGVSNMATADTELPELPDKPVEDDDTIDTPTDDPMPAATVVKEVVERGPVNRWGAMRTSYMLGETINYTFTITNTGNVTLTDLVLEDLVTSTSNPTGHAEQIVLEGVSLAPGEQTTVPFTYTVQSSDLMPVYAADGTTRLTNEIHNRATLTAIGANQKPEEEPISIDSNEVMVTAEHYVRVRFIDNMDGTTLKDVYVMYGGSTTPPTRSERVPHNGYDFIGWVGGVWENVTSDQIIFTAHKMRDRWYPERDEDDDLVILDANIPLAGGYISNVGDCFD